MVESTPIEIQDSHQKETFVWIYEGEVWGLGSSPEVAKMDAYTEACRVTKAMGETTILEIDEVVIQKGFSVSVTVKAGSESELKTAMNSALAVA